jgi:hypothetical protein
MFNSGFWRMLATAIAAGGVFYVLREHWAHAIGLAPYLLFLACPLMHLFMHHGHKHSPGAGGAESTKKQQSAGCH